MQALIDFDGWRKWKDFSQTQNPSADSSHQKPFTLTNAKSPKSPLAIGKPTKRLPSFGGGAGGGDSAASDGTDTNGEAGSSGNEVAAAAPAVVEVA